MAEVYQGAYTGPQIDALLARVNTSPGSLGLSSIIVVTCGSVSDSKRSFVNDAITSNHVVLGYWVSNRAMQPADWIVTTSNGGLTFTGTIRATGNVTLILGVSVGSFSAT